MSRRTLTRRAALRRAAVGAWALWGSGCGGAPAVGPLPVTPRPAWIERPPTADDAYFGVGEGPDGPRAFADAVNKIGAQSDARVSTRTRRLISETTTADALTGGLDRDFAEDFVSQVRIDSAAAVPGVREQDRWQGPDGRVWVLARAPRSQVVDEVRRAVESLLRQWNPGAGDRVVVLPPVDLVGRATSLSAHLLGGLIEHLRALRPGLDLFSPLRLPDAASLERVLAEPPSVALVYGEVEALVDRLLIRLKAISAPSLAADLGAVSFYLPRQGELAVMHGRVRQHLHGVVKPLLMGLTASGAEVSLVISDQNPLPGELVQIMVRSDRDGWLTLFDIDPEGRVSRLVPVNADRPFRLRAGVSYIVPDDVPALAGRAVRVYLPSRPGPERLKAIVTPEPLPALAEAFTLSTADLTPSVHARQVESVARLLRMLADLPGVGVASTTYSVRRP